MYTALCSSLLFPVHERLKGHDSVRLRRELEVTQWYGARKLNDLQTERLRALLIHAGAHVPYYRELFTQYGFVPADFGGVADLGKLPRLAKGDIRAAGSRLKSDTAGKLIHYSTGGSTGEPLRFSMGRGRVDHDVAAKWRATRWWGVDIGDPEIVLWGSPVELSRQDRLKGWRDRLLRSHLLPAFNMSEQQLAGYIERIVSVKPRMLFGYASALALLATFAATRGTDLTRLGVRVAFATGETLYPEQREIISRVFAAPVANGYGSRDAGFIAHQCAEGSLHVSAEHIVVELLDDAGQPVAPGTPGEVTVTHLATADFPFIRYRTGDMAVADSQPCPCGRGLPVLREVLGRSSDFIRTANGTVMHALALIYEVRDVPGIARFKFVQAGDLSIELQIVAATTFSAATERQIVDGLRKRLGADAVVNIRRVADIQPEPSGKYRYVISNAAATVGGAGHA